MDRKQSLTAVRVTGKEYTVTYMNEDKTIALGVHYKGTKPLRAMLTDYNQDMKTGILLDYIQLVIKEKELSLAEYHVLGE